MPDVKEFYFPSSTGKSQIYARMWLPDGEVRATVQLAHGIAEYIERYDDFAKFLAENGIAVCGNDHLGHGKSIDLPENRGFFAEKNGWDYVVADMKSLHELIMKEFPGKPCVLFGHSMGSFLSRTYLIKHPKDFDAAILCGTGHQSGALVEGGLMLAKIITKRHGPKYQSSTLNDIAFGAYNKGFNAAPGETAWLSRDREMVKKYDADPLCGFVPTCSLFGDMMGGVKFIKNPKNLLLMNKKMPVFFIAGGDDPVGDKGKGVERAYKSFVDAGMEDVMMQLYPGGRHEILNEICREKVYSDVLDWINCKI